MGVAVVKQIVLQKGIALVLLESNISSLPRFPQDALYSQNKLFVEKLFQSTQPSTRRYPMAGSYIDAFVVIWDDI